MSKERRSKVRWKMRERRGRCEEKKNVEPKEEKDGENMEVDDGGDGA